LLNGYYFPVLRPHSAAGTITHLSKFTLQQDPMYLEFFGMRELPFTLTPNTDFFIDLDGHHQAFDIVQRALASGEGFIKITGEVGTGKTLLCRRLLNQLTDPFVTAYIPNPFLTPDGFMLALAEELDLPVVVEKGRHHILGQINDKLVGLRQAGKRVVLLLDEAQAMPEASIESLRLMTNLETETEKLLQIVLFGQPELNDLLNRESLRQLKQRITFAYELPVLMHDEVVRYINDRLAKAGFPGLNLFSNKALDDLYQASAGIPRLINILAHKSLLVAYGREDTKISHLHVARAVADTEDAHVKRHYAHLKPGFRWQAMLVACLFASGLTLVGAWYVFRS
jgi:MSHA biogenesis protein MshM